MPITLRLLKEYLYTEKTLQLIYIEENFNYTYLHNVWWKQSDLNEEYAII